MRGDPVQTNSTSTYQPRHEEGNLFSYPASLSEVEGYRADAGLMTPVQQITIPSSNKRAFSLSFNNAKSVSDQSTTTSTPSEMTKTMNFFESAWCSVKNFFTGGNDSVEDTPDQTEDSQAFTKSYATDEEFSVQYTEDTTLLDKDVIGYWVNLMPFVAKEGAVKLAAAVNLDLEAGQNHLLWGENSLYRKKADPALLLPNKFRASGQKFIAEENNRHAMLLRGIRFYSEEFSGYSDSILVPKLTYRIEVPVYNASFLNVSPDVTVRLSYSRSEDLRPEAARTLIGETKVKLKGWSNQGNTWNNGNRAVANFWWTIPDSIQDGVYFFYVELDPENAINEVHEQRMYTAQSGKVTVADCGGNNTGFFPFSVLHLSEANYESIRNGSVAASARNGELFSSVARASDNFGVSQISASSVERTAGLPLVIRFNGMEDLNGIYDLLNKARTTSPDDPVVIECEIENPTSNVFPEVYLFGYNLKEGEYNRMLQSNGSYSDFTTDSYSGAFLRHKTSLFAKDKTSFTFEIIPSKVHWTDGAKFALEIPNVWTEIADDHDDPDDPDYPDHLGVSASSGGCGATGSVGLLVMLAAALVVQKVKL